MKVKISINICQTCVVLITFFPLEMKEVGYSDEKTHRGNKRLQKSEMKGAAKKQ